MKFGKLPHVGPKTNILLPPNSEMTNWVLGKWKKEDTQNFYFGLPLWADPEFKGVIFPETAKSSEYLKFYSMSFNSIELNSTFYGIPKETTVQNWVSSVGDDFKFCPKFPKELSFQSDFGVEDPLLDHFLEFSKQLGNNLGECFFQLPSHFGPEKLPKLIQFIEKIQGKLSYSVEFRHPKFFNPQTLTRVWKELLLRKVGMVMSDTLGRRDALHMCLSSRNLIVRFLGQNLHESDFKRIEDWVERLRIWGGNGPLEIYFFIHQSSEKQGVPLVQKMIPHIRELASNEVPDPHLPRIEEESKNQLTFF